MSGGTVREGARQCRARWVGRCLVGVALVVAAAGAAGTAAAADRSTDVACVDQTTGAWEASMTFSSVAVQEAHPVVLTFGSASVTLTDPGPGGGATLTQSFDGGQAGATKTWTIVRNGAVDQSGSVTFDRPAGCEAAPTTPPPTEAPPTEPPATDAPPTGPPETEAGPQATLSPRPDSPNPAPAVPAAPARPRAAPLPVTGVSTLAGLGLAAAAVAVGALVIRWTRRRADQFIGD
ncbi:MAG TPA: hypothetical protein VFP08_12140 [Acidimicrobiales bacterium]|nr:hypothetical protein [Acidimicrobiales bacterium]